MRRRGGCAIAAQVPAMLLAARNDGGTDSVHTCYALGICGPPRDGAARSLS